MWLLRYAAVCNHGGYLLVPTATYIEEPISGGHIGCGSSPVREATQGNAFLAKPGKLSQLVSKLINNEEKLYSISKSAYDYATQRRTWENTIDETIDLYKNVI